MSSSKYVFQFIYFVLSLGLILASTSCQSEKKNSILVLAFDRLPSDAVNCSDERTNDNSGFSLLCKESIRFTHSYTTSLQPAAAMGSLLSGQYPYQHQLHRSFDRISNESELVTQWAAEKNMRTSFFSGSPHILKKTGLSKYFETFDDSSAITEKNYFKDFKMQTENLIEWLSEDSKPFFAVIYNSELEFLGPDDSNRFEKIDENLALLIKHLKADLKWESTAILLVGLNGANKYQRLNETKFQNLHSENTQVVTMLKLPRAKGDEGVYWKNDTPVQTADLGQLLKQVIQPRPDMMKSKVSTFNTIDLFGLINSKTNQNTDSATVLQRQILIEAPNSWSKNLDWARFAILQNQDLLIDAVQPEIYNTLTDRTEITNLFSEKENIFEKTRSELAVIKKEMGLRQPPNLELKNKIKKIIPTEHLINLNIELENIWGLSSVN
jgi:hypothetical protein